MISNMAKNIAEGIENWRTETMHLLVYIHASWDSLTHHSFE
jgi:hypothetical protein